MCNAFYFFHNYATPKWQQFFFSINVQHLGHWGYIFFKISLLISIFSKITLLILISIYLKPLYRFRYRYFPKPPCPSKYWLEWGVSYSHKVGLCGRKPDCVARNWQLWSISGMRHHQLTHNGEQGHSQESEFKFLKRGARCVVTSW